MGLGFRVYKKIAIAYTQACHGRFKGACTRNPLLQRRLMEAKLCLVGPAPRRVWRSFGVNLCYVGRSETLLGGSGDLVTSCFCRLISTITPIRIPFRVLITLLNIYLLSPPTLQVNPVGNPIASILRSNA